MKEFGFELCASYLLLAAKTHSSKLEVYLRCRNLSSRYFEASPQYQQKIWPRSKNVFCQFIKTIKIGQVNESRQRTFQSLYRKIVHANFSDFFANTDVFTVGEYLSPGCFFLAHLEVFSYIALCKIIRITRWHTHCGSIPYEIRNRKEAIENEKKEGNSDSGASIQ